MIITPTSVIRFINHEYFHETPRRWYDLKLVQGIVGLLFEPEGYLCQAISQLE